MELCNYLYYSLSFWSIRILGRVCVIMTACRTYDSHWWRGQPREGRCSLVENQVVFIKKAILHNANFNFNTTDIVISKRSKIEYLKMDECELENCSNEMK